MPPPEPQEKEKKETGFKFGLCSRPLGADYRKYRTPEEWQSIQTKILSHDDVVWIETKTFGSPGGTLGFHSYEEKDSAGHHPADKGGVWWIGTVPGAILTPKPMPPATACDMTGIDKEKYGDVAIQVASDRASPPDYNLCFNNCKNWARLIQDLAE